MKAYDRDFIQRKIEEKNKFIRSQHKLPKSQRDEAAIADEKARKNQMESWLKETPKNALSPVKSTMSKSEFKEQFNNAFGLKEADSIMKLETLEDVKQAWTNIKGRNITIDGPPEVKAEIMRLYREEYGQMNVRGFKPRKL